MAFVTGQTLGVTLCEILGIPPGRCRRIAIICEVDALVEVHVLLSASQAKRIADVVSQIPPEQITTEVEVGEEAQA